MSKNLYRRMDFDFKLITIFPLLTVLLTYPAMAMLPENYFYENHLIENMQLIVLFATFLLSINAKIDKKFFNSIALVCIILFLREINCGRTIFFAIEGAENAFLSWKEIPYGYLAHPIYGVFIAASGLYFILTKSYKVLFNYLVNAKLSIYNWVFMFLGIIAGVAGEKLNNMRLEEMTEMLFYCSFMALVYLQSQNDDYIEAVKDTVN